MESNKDTMDNLKEVVDNSKELIIQLKEQNLLIADLLIRVSALEKTLTDKDIISKYDLENQVKAIGAGVIKFLESKQINKN